MYHNLLQWSYHNTSLSFSLEYDIIYVCVVCVFDQICEIDFKDA